jgi:hypothetical protein
VSAQTRARAEAAAGAGAIGSLAQAAATRGERRRAALARAGPREQRWWTRAARRRTRAARRRSTARALGSAGGRPAARLWLQATARIQARRRLQLAAGGSGAAWWRSTGGRGVRGFRQRAWLGTGARGRRGSLRACARAGGLNGHGGWRAAQHGCGCRAERAGGAGAGEAAGARARASGWRRRRLWGGASSAGMRVRVLKQHGKAGTHGSGNGVEEEKPCRATACRHACVRALTGLAAAREVKDYVLMRPADTNNPPYVERMESDERGGSARTRTEGATVVRRSEYGSRGRSSATRIRRAAQD